MCLVLGEDREIRTGTQEEGIYSSFLNVGRGFGIIIRGLGVRLYQVRIDYSEIIAVPSPTVSHTCVIEYKSYASLLAILLLLLLLLLLHFPLLPTG